jgi:hypothetical protein
MFTPTGQVLASNPAYDRFDHTDSEDLTAYLTEQLHLDAVEEEPYIINCICGFNGDDGNTIYCEKCDTWQHIACFYPDNQDQACREDFTHSCAECLPRFLDVEGARKRAIVSHVPAPRDASSEELRQPPSNRNIIQDEAALEKTSERRWILDRVEYGGNSKNEDKFLFTCVDPASVRKRVRVSINYSLAHSLGAEIRSTPHKKMEIVHKAVQESLADLQLYDTFTDIRLETQEGRLRAYVIRDVIVRRARTSNPLTHLQANIYFNRKLSCIPQLMVAE